MPREPRTTARMTIADVAREAGVSRQTVSRVINNKGEISHETLENVRAVIACLGYRPSGIARGLATQKTLTIGLVVPDIANPFFADVARGAEDTARQAGYSLLLFNTAEDPEREAEVLTTLEEKCVDGVLMCSPRMEAEPLAVLLARHRAVVLLNRQLPGSSLRAVLVDDASGTMSAVRHLLQAGRRVIGFLAGPAKSYSGQERRRGYVAGLAEAGLPLETDLQSACQPTFEGGHQAAGQLLTACPAIDALLCYNDLVAAGALVACLELGRRVPQDVAVIGADDVLLASLITPALTTLRVDKRGIGAAAIGLLLAEIGGRSAGCEDIVCQPILVVRASTD